MPGDETSTPIQYPNNWPHKKPAPGVFFEGELLTSPAFNDLGLSQVRALIRFYQKRQLRKKKGRRNEYEIVNDGDITFTYGEAEAMGISRPAFSRALTGLIERGFIDTTYVGEGMFRSASRFGISERWRLWNTERFVGKDRPRRRQRSGFQKAKAGQHAG